MKDVDSEDLFATSVAAETRKMPQRVQCMVKNELKQVFKFQTICGIPLKCIHLHLKIALKISINNKVFKHQKPHQA